MTGFAGDCDSTTLIFDPAVPQFAPAGLSCLVSVDTHHPSERPFLISIPESWSYRRSHRSIPEAPSTSRGIIITRPNGIGHPAISFRRLHCPRLINCPYRAIRPSSLVTRIRRRLFPRHRVIPPLGPVLRDTPSLTSRPLLDLRTVPVVVKVDCRWILRAIWTRRSRLIRSAKGHI